MCTTVAVGSTHWAYHSMQSAGIGMKEGSLTARLSRTGWATQRKKNVAAHFIRSRTLVQGHLDHQTWIYVGFELQKWLHLQLRSGGLHCLPLLRTSGVKYRQIWYPRFPQRGCRSRSCRYLLHTCVSNPGSSRTRRLSSAIYKTW